MQKILSYYYPDTELDVPTLRTIASECASGQLLAHPNPVKFQDTHAKVAPRTVHKGTLISEMPPQTEDDSAVQEIVQLHEEYGCMLADARGEYRKSFGLGSHEASTNDFQATSEQTLVLVSTVQSET